MILLINIGIILMVFSIIMEIGQMENPKIQNIFIGTFGLLLLFIGLTFKIFF